MFGFECSMRRFAQSRLRLSKTCSARPEPLDLKKAVSAAFGSAREAFLGIIILYLSVSTDVSREIQVRCLLLLLLYKKWPCFTRKKIENIPGFTKGYDALCLNTLIYLDSSMDALGVLMVRVPWMKYMITISPMEDSTTRIHPCTNFFLSIQCLSIDTFRAIHPGQWLFENAMRPNAVHNHDLW